MKVLITFMLTCLFSLACWAAHAVNVNTASAEEIAEALTGIGLSKAEAIVSYRQANGEFKHPDELVNVKGIGLRTLERNREFILVKNDPKLASREN